MESYEQCVIVTMCKQSYCSLSTLDTIHRLFVATRLIINQINKVQWVDLSWRMSSYLSIPKTQWASASLFLRNGELLGHSPIHNMHRDK